MGATSVPASPPFNSAALAAGLATATGAAAVYARNRELGSFSLADPIFGGLSSSSASHNTTVMQTAVAALAAIAVGSSAPVAGGFGWSAIVSSPGVSARGPDKVAVL
jgi:hypothetical protein